MLSSSRITLTILVSFLVTICTSRSPVTLNPEYQKFSYKLIDDAKDLNYKLPTDIEPFKYDITITTGIAKHDTKFEGKSTIMLKVLKKTSVVVLHAKNLEIQQKDVKLSDAALHDIGLKKFTLSSETETIELTFEDPLEETPVGEYYVLKLKWKGELNEALNGFYKSSYVDKDGVTRLLATTHFEPTYARSAFPCWDEPAYKSIFQIVLKYHDGYQGISNMPINKDTVDKNGMRTTEFKPTPPMSSYLVAFVVSDFGNVTNEGKSFTVWTRKNALHQAVYARDVGQKILKTLEEYTKIPFAVPKMDQIAIPDFAAGAMENWGLVTYRESRLLYEENVTTTRDQTNVASVIAHEFAHQWFGNLVTPQWWEWLWLSEGFATYFQNYVIEKVFPKWKAMSLFVVNGLQQAAFAIDVSEKARPMNSPVASPKEIKDIFDAISYQKAGSVIRMMGCTFPGTVFQEGLQTYLVENSHKAATSDSLFSALQTKVDQVPDKFPNDFKVKTFMDPWVNQAGYPMIRVERFTPKGAALPSNSIKITQERFTMEFSKNTDKSQWYIPLSFTTEQEAKFDDTTTKLWLKPSESLELDVKISSTQWIIFNLQRCGYYRVNYDETSWNLISKQLNGEDYGKIHELNRAQLIDDAFNMAFAGKLKFTVPLDLALYLQREKDYIPWVSALANFDYLDKMLIDSAKYKKFQDYVATRIYPFMETLKYEEQPEDEHLTKLARPEIMDWACKVGIKNCTQFVQKKFKSWLENPTERSIPVNIFGPVLCGALRNADSATWGSVLKLYANKAVPYDKNVIISSLGCSRSEDILKEYLKISQNVTFSLPFSSVLKAVYEKSPRGIDVVLDFAVDNVEVMAGMEENNYSELRQHLEGMSKRVVSSNHFVKMAILIMRLQKMFVPENLLFPMHQRSISNIYWLRKHQTSIEKWLDERVFAFPKENNGKNSANSLAIGGFLAMFVPCLVTLFS